MVIYKEMHKLTVQLQGKSLENTLNIEHVKGVSSFKLYINRSTKSTRPDIPF